MDWLNWGIHFCGVALFPAALAAYGVYMATKTLEGREKTIAYIVILALGVLGVMAAGISQWLDSKAQYKLGKRLETIEKANKNIASGVENAQAGISTLQKPKPLEKAKLGITFWPPASDSSLINTATIPIENGVVTVTLGIKNISKVQARNGAIWFRVYNGCRFEEDPQGLKTYQEVGNFIVKGTNFVAIYAGAFLQPIRFKIIPPVEINSFIIDFAYTCDECPPADVDIKDIQKLTVFIKR